MVEKAAENLFEKDYQLVFHHFPLHKIVKKKFTFLKHNSEWNKMISNPQKYFKLNKKYEDENEGFFLMMF